MVLRSTAQRKMPPAQLSRHIVGPMDAVASPVNSVTDETSAAWGMSAAPRVVARGWVGWRQPWMNCIWVPARSMMSPFFSEITPSPTGLPLTVGCETPSTCDST